MRENGYSLGGEQSGHIIFGDIETTGDGIMTSLRIMEVLRAERETLSQLCAPVKIFPQVLVNVRSERKAELDSCQPVWEAVRAAEEKLGDRGRIPVSYTHLGARSMCRSGSAVSRRQSEGHRVFGGPMYEGEPRQGQSQALQ